MPRRKLTIHEADYKGTRIVSLTRAISITKYNDQYLKALARDGKIYAVKLNSRWWFGLDDVISMRLPLPLPDDLASYKPSGKKPKWRMLEGM